MLREVVAIPVVNQVTLLVIVLLLALHHPCVVAVVLDMEEASEVDMPGPIVQPPATNVADPIIMLATAKLRP